MKRKFSLSRIKPIKGPEPGSLKPTSINFPQISPRSSLYVPPSPLLGRPPPLSPETERELREACAEILKNFKPSGYEFMFQPQPTARHVCTRANHKPDEKKSEPEPQPPLVRRRPSGIFPKFRRGSTASETVEVSQGQTYQHVPSNAATSFAKTTTVRKPGLNGRRASSDQLRDTRSHARSNSNVVRQASLNVSNASNARPRTASGVLESNSNSSSTTRSNTTWDRTDASRSTSGTTVGSRDHTPAEYASPPEGKHGVSDPPCADAAAAAWMTRELSKRRSEIERPLSRSSRVMNYLRPRPSMESVRSVQSVDPPAGITWWTGNAVPKSPDPQTTDLPKALDLNRALPPLPSLSTWNSNTTAPSYNSPSFVSGGKGVHVAQLMRGSSLAKRPSATVVDEMGGERVISRAEERQREKDLRRLVEEKMRGGSIVSPTVSPKLARARQKSDKVEEKRRRKEDSARSDPRPMTAKPSAEKEPETAAGPGEKKMMSSLRRQWSKLSLGGMLAGRQRKEHRASYGRMVEEGSAVFNEKGVLQA